MNPTSIPQQSPAPPNFNPTATMGNPQHDHSNTKAISQQYHNNIVGIHTAITEIPQSRHSNITAIPQQHHRKFHIIPHQYCRNRASLPQQYHLNPIENANENKVKSTAYHAETSSKIHSKIDPKIIKNRSKMKPGAPPGRGSAKKHLIDIFLIDFEVPF